MSSSRVIRPSLPGTTIFFSPAASLNCHEKEHGSEILTLPFIIKTLYNNTPLKKAVI
jgi:hypothetical protein